MAQNMPLVSSWAEQVRELAQSHTRISRFMIRRRFRMPRLAAERLLWELEQEGVVGPPSPGGSREVLEHA